MTAPADAPPPRSGGVLSPCVKVCALDATGRWCVGCFRTTDEIARWAALDDATRLAIMAALPARRARLAPTGGSC